MAGEGRSCAVTDQAAQRIDDDTCGILHQFTEVMFFPKSNGINLETDPAWGTQKVHGPQSFPPCQTRSAKLLATEDNYTPTWWKTSSASGRSFSVHWDCCCDEDSFVTTMAKPAYEPSGNAGEMRPPRVTNAQLEVAPTATKSCPTNQEEGHVNAKLLCVIWTVFCVSPDVAAAETPVWSIAGTIEYSYPVDGGQYISKITRELRDSSPDWMETESNPPLSARKAISLAEATLRATLKDKADPSYERYLSAAKLVPLGGKKWCWEVCYVWHVRVGGSTGEPPGFRVFVLMNGKVVQPVEVDGYRERHSPGKRKTNEPKPPN